MMRTDWKGTLETWHAVQSEVDELRDLRNAVNYPGGYMVGGGYFHTYGQLREALDELLPAMQWYADLFKEGLLRQLDAVPLATYAVSPIVGNYIMQATEGRG